MNLSTIYPIITGFQFAYTLHVPKKSEDTVKQGKNYTYAAIFQFNQIILAFSEVNALIAYFSAASRFSFLARSAGYLTELTALATVGIYCASTSKALHSTLKEKDPDFKEKATFVKMYVGNRYKFLKPILNALVSEKTAYLVNNHAGNAAQALAFAATLVNFSIGKRIQSMSALAVMGICLLDQKGKLPEKVSVFFNNRLPFFAFSCGVIVGQGMQRIIAGINATLVALPVVLQPLSNRADIFIENRLKKHDIQYPSLKELTQPYVASTTLTKEDILSEGKISFLVNPLHVRRSPAINPQAHAEYSDLMTLFEKINWTDKKNLALLDAKLADDEAWDEFLNSADKVKALKGFKIYWAIKNSLLKTIDWNHPENFALLEKNLASNEIWKGFSGIFQEQTGSLPSKKETIDWALRASFLAKIDWNNEKNFALLDKHLAADSAWQELIKRTPMVDQLVVTPEYKIYWATQQLDCFIQNISGKKTPKGDLSGMPQIRQSCQISIHYLNAIAAIIDKPETSEQDRKKLSVKMQDMLIKFAIEGGDHCVQAIDRVVRENLDDALLSNDSGRDATPLMARLDIGMKQLRLNWANAFYYSTKKIMPSFTQAIDPNDIHIFNEFMRLWGQGLGLDLSAALRDKTVRTTPLAEQVTPIIASQARNAFWQGAYTAKPTSHTDENAQIVLVTLMIQSMEKITNRVSAKARSLPSWSWSWSSTKAYLSFMKGVLSAIKSIFVGMYISSFEAAKSLAPHSYDAKSITEQAMGMIGPYMMISNKEYSEWWQRKTAEIAGDNEDLCTELQTQLVDIFGEGLFTQDPDTKDSKLNMKYVELMLLEMGFLKKAEPIPT